MKGLRLLQLEFQRAVHNGRMPYMIVLVAILGLLSSVGEIISDASSEFQHSTIWYFDNAFTVNSWFLPVWYSLGTYAAVSYFCQEWRTGYWKPLELRTGKKVYLYGKSINCFLLGFCTAFWGLLLYLLMLIGIGAIIGYPLYDPISDRENIQPILYLVLRIVTFAASAGFWSMAGLLMASIQNDSFIAVTMPLALNMTVDYVLRRLTGGSFSTMKFATLSSIPENYILSAIYGTVVFILLGAVCGWIVTEFLRKRVENEWYS